MSYSLENKLVIGLASSALFDLEDSDAVFKSKGELGYREYQQQQKDIPLKTGVAYPLIRRLLHLNSLSTDEPLIEVILLSKNDPDTGIRVMNSIKYYDLAITRAVFLQGESPHKYIPAFNIVLFLSANAADVTQAINEGYPAGHVLDGNIKDNTADAELRIAFDFDGVLADDESEKVYQSSGDLTEFHAHEKLKEDIPHNPGPLKNFLKRISDIQKLEEQQAKQENGYQPVLKICIVTARNAPSHKRVVNTMRTWGINVNQAFFLGGIEKVKILEVLNPHIFFDDQKLHLTKSASMLPSVHIPFGITNNR